MFRNENFDLEYIEGSDSLAAVLDDQFKSLIKYNPGYMTKKLAVIRDASHLYILRAFETSGYVNLYNVSMPHDLAWQ